MTLYDEYRKQYPINPEPSEFRGIVEAEIKRALAWQEARKPLPAEEIKPGRYRMTVDVVIGYCKYYGRDTDHDCLGCSQFRIIEPEIICPNGWLDGATFHAEEEKI